MLGLEVAFEVDVEVESQFDVASGSECVCDVSQNWAPTQLEILKVAHDVAAGMDYLHTRFEDDDSRHELPVIHRDLKSPNLLLAHPPMEGKEVVVKIADFGLSRDKSLDHNFDQTALMTGCGSVLWMAPEILAGDTYQSALNPLASVCLLN